MPQTEFGAWLTAHCARLERALDRWLPVAETAPRDLHAAMRYTALGPGKRLRPALVYATGLALGAAPEDLDAPACAVELIHAYSLVHDDLPAMDDDALRRGRATCHIAFGEAIAILTGDALQSLAFQLLANAPMPRVTAATRLVMLDRLAAAAGSRGMAGGQAMDLAASDGQTDFAELEATHIHKTGALIRCAVALGALAAQPDDEARGGALDHYAKCVGLAFQIRDDMLDVEGDPELTGKTMGTDQRQQRVTYASLLGLPAARERAAALRDAALRSIADLGAAAEPLRWLCDFTVTRQR